MGVIITIEGSWAVGKSTLLQRWKALHPSYLVHDGLEKYDAGADLSDEASYCQHERRYLRHFLAEERRLRAQPQPVLRIRGTEAAAFYAFYFPQSHGHAWDIERLLREELAALRATPSDLLLYLHASVPTILQRAAQDTTKRRAKLSRWLEAWQAPTEAFFRSLPQTIVIDTDGLSPDEVLRAAEHTLSRWFAEWGRRP